MPRIFISFNLFSPELNNTQQRTLRLCRMTFVRRKRNLYRRRGTVACCTLCGVLFLCGRTFHFLKSTTRQRVAGGTVACSCAFPESEKPAENGYTCSTPELSGFCAHNEVCDDGGQPWTYGEFPCISKTARVACYCNHPGSERDNGYTCSDSAFNDRCGWRRVCLPPVGHVFAPSENPCAWKSDARRLQRFKAYSSVSRAHPCSRTLIEDATADPRTCELFDELQLIIPDCSSRKRVVPRIIHSIGRVADNFLHRSIVASNPLYISNRHTDLSALDYIEKGCGLDARHAFECLLAPSFRADLFRFCALYADGGVYMDEDMVPLRNIDQIISTCSSATIGHDYPAGNRPAKQMKILAAEPKSQLMRCAVNSIISHVRDRAHPPSPLGLTGPLMLQECYMSHSIDVAITYLDTRGAVWPYTGMRAGNIILAYEYPDSPKHFCAQGNCDSRDYAQLYKKGKIYSPECQLSGSGVVSHVK